MIIGQAFIFEKVTFSWDFSEFLDQSLSAKKQLPGHLSYHMGSTRKLSSVWEEQVEIPHGKVRRQVSKT